LLILSSKHGCFPEGGRVFLILLLVLLAPSFSRAQEKTTSSGGHIIVCMIQLEHADAEYLASVLKPFLSTEGSIVPYKTSNTLIIKDRAPVVNMLSEVIKGKPCAPISEQPEVETGLQQEEADLDR
jgi:type II secretory pathway component GspD/PulD (secretin)